MQGASLAQKQQVRAMPLQIQANAILGMSLLELQQFIQSESMENPALSVEEGGRCPVCGFPARESACPVCGAALCKDPETPDRDIHERDYLDRAFAAVGYEDDFDPFRTVASGTDLKDYLGQQARMSLGGRRLRIAQYIIDSLDDDGYLRESLFDIAEEFASAVPEIEDVLSIVQSFDPPGIAARDLRECLLLQLRALGSQDAVAAYAEKVLSDCWDDFCRMKHKAIARRIEATPQVVAEVCGFIRDTLTPHPATVYRGAFDELSPRDTAAVVPDVVICRNGDSLTIEVSDRSTSTIGVDATYDELYKTLKDRDCHLGEEDRRHIKEHVERVRCILEAIDMRKKTLARVALCLVEYQKDFIDYGPSHLKPLRQKDIARMLEVHESTICRAIANKFCRLPSGEIISFEVFFDSALPVRTMISQLVASSSRPLSDGEIAGRLAEQGITIARRTVAKYREQLKLLPYQLRAA